MKDIKESLNAVSRPKTLFGGQDSAKKSRIWYSNAECTLQRDNKPEPLITTPLPDRVWQIVATDLFKLKGVDYLVVIDYFSEIRGGSSYAEDKEVK